MRNYLIYHWGMFKRKNTLEQPLKELWVVLFLIQTLGLEVFAQTSEEQNFFENEEVIASNIERNRRRHENNEAAADTYETIHFDGQFRNLLAEKFLHARSTNFVTSSENQFFDQALNFNSMMTTRARKVMILLPGLVENSYWYQIEKKGYSLADFFLKQGFDVIALSYIARNQNIEPSTETDASFRELIGNHIPKLHEYASNNYDQVFYFCHSYGNSIISSFLMGYEAKKSADGLYTYVPNHKKAYERQRKTTAVISMSGLFKLYWPMHYKNFFKPENFSVENWFKTNPAFQVVLETTPLKLAELIRPVLRFDLMKYLHLNHLPEWLNMVLSWAQIDLISKYANPIFYMPNADPQALKLALTNGLGSETIETVNTISSMYDGTVQPNGVPQSQAFRNFQKDLHLIKVPAYFIVGDKDLVTHWESVYKFGYQNWGANNKKFELLKDVGHVDIFLSKDPELLKNKISGWMKQFE